MTASSDSATPPIRDLATDALRYWELHRLIYNAVLGLIVIVYFCVAWPGSKETLRIDSFLQLFLLAVAANVFYCAAYLVDGFVQLSGFRPQWRKMRVGLFLLGTAVAGILTRFIVMGLFKLGM